MAMILPGATLGIVGGGQLGRLFTLAARSMGYDVVVLDPHADSPAGGLATRHLCAPYDDATALAELAQACAAITVEFENVPADSLARLAEQCIVRPAADAVRIAQDRIREKNFLRAAGFATAPFAVVQAEADLEQGMAQIGVPAVLKVSRHGYDGKGQVVIAQPDAARDAWASLRHEPCVLEARVALDTEVSVVVARAADGAVAVFPVAENRHRHGILDVSCVPAAIAPALAQDAMNGAIQIATALAYVGVMAVEYFVSDGRLLVNEIAPRPHNSGHYTLDACLTSQFEQQVRALCGLPLGNSGLLAPAVMVNLLGDLWRDGRAPAWDAILAQPNAKLHLYGKRDARAGRKMGHFTVLGASRETAWEAAERLRASLGMSPASDPAGRARP